MAESVLQYILDANVFIQACKLHYAFDLCPGFWESVRHHGAEKMIASIDRVKDELQEGDDLDQWKLNAPDGFFIDTNQDDILTSYAEVIQWAELQDRFTGAAKAAFADDVDAWLIACAKARGFTMVTHEVRAQGSKKTVKIPDVCDAFAVKSCNPFEMLRELQISYRWDASAF